MKTIRRLAWGQPDVSRNLEGPQWVISGMWADNRGGKRVFQLIAGVGFLVSMGWDARFAEIFERNCQMCLIRLFKTLNMRVNNFVLLLNCGQKKTKR